MRVSTKPCPQCGTPVPLQARFCGRCGHTLASSVDASPPARKIPVTVDEATADPPAVQVAPAAPIAAGSQPRMGNDTVMGHAAISLDSIAVTQRAPSRESVNPLGKTMLLGGSMGPEIPAPARSPRGQATALGSDNQTMVGVPSAGLVPPQPTPQAASLLPLQKTMLGVG